jgi:O-methyltransferase
MYGFIRLLGLSFFKSVNYFSTQFAKLHHGTYQLVLPFATYAPWLKDSSFNSAYNQVKHHSLIVKTQAYELWQLVAETNHLPGNIIEIGCWRGASLIVMATKALQLKSTSVVYGCDTFEGVVKAGNNDNYYQNGMHKDTTLETLQHNITTLGLHNIVLYKGIFPDETGHLLSASIFKLCHIDVDTYDSAKDSLTFLWPKLTVGGLVVFNDYGYPRTKGITQFVNELRNEDDKIIIHNLNGNAVIIKTK